ncbi:MAG: S8 family serine peptidase [Caldilineaceae bacterium]
MTTPIWPNHPDHVVAGENGNYYFRMSGTSMSAGIAAGTVALLLSADKKLTPDQVKYHLDEQRPGHSQRCRSTKL